MDDDGSILKREMERVELRPFPLDAFHRRRQRKQRNRRIGTAVVALAVVAAGYAGLVRVLIPERGSRPADQPPSSSAPQNVMALADFAALEPGTYFIDPDADPSTPLRVVYEVPFEGWAGWIGAAKFAPDAHVGVSITTVRNLVRHGCRDHNPADPPVGPTVDDLATALSNLAPFEVTSPPRDVSVYGYRGKHLKLVVPGLAVEGQGNDRRFARCIGGNLKSWISPPALAGTFYGYNREPGFTEEFWILDVEGTRLMIAAERSPSSPPEDHSELRAILDSIRIDP